MEQVTIGTKNQIVIPKAIRKKIKGLKPGRKVKVYPLNEDTLAVTIDKQNWLDISSGLMKKAWSKIDPIKELEKIRNEW